MPATPIRRRATRAVLAGAVALIVLSGCTTGQKAPGSYSGAEDNFLEGCINTATNDNKKDEPDTTVVKDPEGYCQCSFDAISADGGVPYSEFKKIQSRMQDEGGPLPSSYLEVVDASCDPSTSNGEKAGSGSDSGSDSDSTTTTTGSDG